MSHSSATGMAEDAFNYTIDGDVVRRVAIGGLLVSFSILILPLVYVFGYYVNVMQQTIRGDDKPPVFSGDRVTERLKTGLEGLVVSIGHSIPVIVLAGGIVVGIALTVLGGTTEGAPGMTGSVLVIMALIGSGVMLVGSLYLGLVIPAGMLLYADTGRISAAFSPSELKEVILVKPYLIAYLFSAVLLTAAGVVGGIVGLIPFVGFLFIGFFQFPAIVASYRMFTLAVIESSYSLESSNDSQVVDATGDVQ